MNEQQLIDSAQPSKKEESNSEEKNDGVSNPEDSAQEAQEANQQATETKSLNESEQKAYDLGWRSKEEYEGNPENWTPAGVFLKYQTLQSTVNDLKASNQSLKTDFEQRLERNNKLHEFNVDNMKKQLEAKRLVAVEEGDIEGFQTNQKQLDDLNQQYQQIQPAQTVQPTVEPDIQSWIDRNPWIVNTSPNYDVGKSQVADGLLKQIENQNPHMDRANQLNLLDGQLGKLYNATPQGNPKRIAPNNMEIGKRSGVNRKRDLSMSDLTFDEKDAWQKLGKPIFKDNEKLFLKSVQDQRQGASA